MVQETRRWDDNKDATYSMRSKENAQDYRYFPEPDIPPLELSEAYLDRLRAEQPEMARARRARYQRQYGLSEYDAGQITARKALVDFFEATVALGAPPRETANWMLGEMLRRLKEEELEPGEMKLTPENLAALIDMVERGTINRNTAAKVFRAVFPDNADPRAYVKEHGLEQVDDPSLVERAVEQVLAENAAAAADFRAGNGKALGFLVGQVMGRLKGRADPRAVNAAVRERLSR